MPTTSSGLEVPARLDLIPRPDHLGELLFMATVAPVHIGVQHLDERLVAFADFRLGPVILGFEDVERAPLGRRQFARTGDALARVARGVLTQDLMRVVDAKA